MNLIEEATDLLKDTYEIMQKEGSLITNIIDSIRNILIANNYEKIEIENDDVFGLICYDTIIDAKVNFIYIDKDTDVIYVGVYDGNCDEELEYELDNSTFNGLNTYYDILSTLVYMNLELTN